MDLLSGDLFPCCSQINSRDASGQTPLHLACEHGDPVCVKELLEESQALTDIKNHKGETPMHSAAKHDSPAIIQVRQESSHADFFVHFMLNCALAKVFVSYKSSLNLSTSSSLHPVLI